MFDESLTQQPDNDLQRLAQTEKQKKIDEYRRPFLESLEIARARDRMQKLKSHARDIADELDKSLKEQR